MCLASGVSELMNSPGEEESDLDSDSESDLDSKFSEIPSARR